MRSLAGARAARVVLLLLAVATCLALGRGSFTRKTRLWIEDLDSLDPFTRELAASALRESPPHDVGWAMGVLRDRLGEWDPRARAAIVESLAVLARRDPAALVRLAAERPIEDPNERREVELALARGREELLPALLELLRRDEEPDAQALAWLLAIFGCDAAAPLSELVATSPPPVRRRAALAFAALGCELPPIVPALLSLGAAGGPEELRIPYATLVTEGVDARARMWLKASLADHDPLVRALLCLPSVRARLEASAAVAADERTRRFAELAGEAEPILQALALSTHDADPIVARTAASALRQLTELSSAGEDEAPATIERFAGAADGPDPAARALAWIARARAGESGDELVAAARAALADPVACVRVAAALALSRRPLDLEAREHLRSVAGEDDERIVRDAARTALLADARQARRAMEDAERAPADGRPPVHDP